MVFNPGGIFFSSSVQLSRSGRPGFEAMGMTLFAGGTAGPKRLARDGLTPPLDCKNVNEM